MSKIFSVITLRAGNASEEFVIPGIPHEELHADGVETASPSSYGRDPDDFMYDHMEHKHLTCEYAAYSYGSGQTADPDENELLAIAIIKSHGGEIEETFWTPLEPVELDRITIVNPYYTDEDEDDE